MANRPKPKAKSRDSVTSGEPFFLDIDKAPVSTTTITSPTPKRNNRGKTRKHLTKSIRRLILKLVNKAKRKDDKMLHDKNKKNKVRKAFTSLAWLVETAFRGYAGWLLLTKFDNIATTATALYALGTAGLIVISHFVLAHKV